MMLDYTQKKTRRTKVKIFGINVLIMSLALNKPVMRINKSYGLFVLLDCKKRKWKQKR
jgi:hypothetical protein